MGLKAFGFALVLIGSFSATEAAPPTCTEIFSAQSKAKPVQVDNELPNGLALYYKSEIRNLSKREISALNAKSLESIQGYIPPLTDNRAQAVPLSDLKKILGILRSDTYFARAQDADYSRDGTEIGYCFGRAAYVHLLLLKMGLQGESMRKVWILGPNKQSQFGPAWGFHVAIAVYTGELGWVTVDSAEIKPEPIRNWFSSQLSHSIDGRARIYVTTADKFSVDLGRYDRIQMGLDLERERDWYKHYFIDMLTSLRETSLDELGLKALERYHGANVEAQQLSPPKNPAKTFLERLGIF